MSDLSQRFCEDPVSYVAARYDHGFQLAPNALVGVHLAGARKRFDDLKDCIPALSGLFEEPGMSEIRNLDYLVPLLLPYTAYKSYPLSFLDRNRFDALTRWLGGLTAVKLDQVDASRVNSIDDSLRLLDDQTRPRRQPRLRHHRQAVRSSPAPSANVATAWCFRLTVYATSANQTPGRFC